MSMSKVIVVGIDTSENAKGIIEYVIQNIYRPGYTLAIAHFLGIKHIGRRDVLNRFDLEYGEFCQKGKKILNDSLTKLEAIEEVLRKNNVEYVKFFESTDNQVVDNLTSVAREVGAICIVVGMSHPIVLTDYRTYTGYELCAKSQIPQIK